MTETPANKGLLRRHGALLAMLMLAWCSMQIASAGHDVDCQQPACVVCGFTDSVQPHVLPAGGVFAFPPGFAAIVTLTTTVVETARHKTSSKPRAPPVSRSRR